MSPDHDRIFSTNCDVLIAAINRLKGTTLTRHFRIDLLETLVVKSKIQQTKMLVLLICLAICFYLAWQYSTKQNQYNKGRFKVMATYLQL